MNVRFLIPFLAWIPLLFAQETPVEPAVNMRLRFLSLEEKEIEDLWIQQSGEWLTPRIPSEFLANSIRYTGDVNLGFYRKSVNPEGEEIIKPVGGAVLKTGMREALILISEAESGQVIGRVLNTGLQEYAAGSYMIFNFCDRKVALGMAGEVTTLPPEAMSIRTPTVKGREPISIQFIKAGDPDRKSLVTTTWFHNPRQRKIVFLVPDGDRIRVKSLTLYPEPEPEPTED